MRKLVCEQGVDIDCTDGQRRSPLQYAVASRASPRDPRGCWCMMGPPRD